jgi:hypothetical protein
LLEVIRFSWKSAGIFWQVDIWYLSDSSSWCINLMHQPLPALKMCYFEWFGSLCCHYSDRSPLCMCLFDQMDDCNINIRVYFFLWPLEALGSCHTLKYGNMVIPPSTDICFTYCKFMSRVSIPLLCCIYSDLFNAAS